MDDRPNIVFVMTDQQRFDTIASLGNGDIYTPNLDRLVHRGLTYTNAYSTCPVCVPARYTVRTGCEPPTTRIFSNGAAPPAPGQAPTIEGRCGKYLPQVMNDLGYRTFGIGKFHTDPWDEELGYEIHLHSEELYYTPDKRTRDDFAAWIAAEHPEYDFVEGLMGERTEMYYMPQMSPMPAEATVERWAADRAVEQIRADDGRPYFGFVSFIGPHPPFAPPIPFNRLYDPDRMPNPVRGNIETDHMDDQIPYMNRCTWAEDINDPHARVLKSRYYGEITYIDDCLGRILDEIEARDDADNTLICFFADHGDHLGDHHAWQKESFFEASCHVPFLVSWPASLDRDGRRDDLVCLADLFGIATHAAGATDARDGVDVLGNADGRAAGPDGQGIVSREFLAGYYGIPGTPAFKIMIRDSKWKYIYMANGAREQLFDLIADPAELENRATDKANITKSMRDIAIHSCSAPGAADALDGSSLRAFPFETIPRRRIYQFDRSRDITGFPEKPSDILEQWR